MMKSVVVLLFQCMVMMNLSAMEMQREPYDCVARQIIVRLHEYQQQTDLRISQSELFRTFRLFLISRLHLANRAIVELEKFSKKSAGSAEVVMDENNTSFAYNIEIRLCNAQRPDDIQTEDIEALSLKLLEERTRFFAKLFFCAVSFMHEQFKHQREMASQIKSSEIRWTDLFCNFPQPLFDQKTYNVFELIEIFQINRLLVESLLRLPEMQPNAKL